VGGRGAGASLVVVVQELRLVARHVDLHRAVALASLARETQVERLFDLGAPPRRLDRALCAHHLLQQTRAPARRVLLFARRHEARTHRAVLEMAALPDAEA